MSREREAVARIVRETAWAQGSNLRKQEVAEACADAILALLDAEPSSVEPETSQDEGPGECEETTGDEI